MKILILFLTLFLGIHSSSEGSDTRLIILGFDGVDPELLEGYMQEGKLPHLEKLRHAGAYLSLRTTLPPQSPVSWASFATGMNPGKTRIFDFLKRSPGSYSPDFAMVGREKIRILPQEAHRFLFAAGVGLVGFGLFFLLLRKQHLRNTFSVGIALFCFGATFICLQWIPKEIPKPVLRREGESFWKRVSRQGIPSVLIRVPVNFPPEDIPQGRLLAGLGVPDVRKSFGTFSFYTTEEVTAENTEMGGKVIPVQIRDGQIETFLWGPQNFTKSGSPDILPKLKLQVDAQEKRCTLHVQGASYTLHEGEWSPWVTFRFDLNPLLRLHGIARFFLIETSPHFKLYLSPINFHPEKVPPNFSLSSPRSFSKEISEKGGLFKTLGWMQETWGLNEERLSEEAFLEDLFATDRKLEAIMFDQLSQPDWKLFVGVFEGTDRVQHMFWRTLDLQHPAYDAETARRYGDVISKSYEEMDRVVGNVLERFVDQRTILFVLSDHGFHSFRKSIHLNTWLVKNGYMTLKGMEAVRERRLEDLFGQGEFWPNVDWSETKAYALGLAGLYLNRLGREPEGIVSVEDSEALRERLIKELLSLQDPETGENPLLHVYRREDVYSGPYLEEMPDLVLGFRDGYRISWQTALGGIPKEIFEDNHKKWSGDHCSYDPSITSGIFFSNRPLSRRSIHIMDIAPTVLEIFQVPIPSDIDGKSFWINRPVSYRAKRM